MPLLETKGAGSAQGFGLSLGGEEAGYIEEVFSTYLYTGNGSTQTITNGIDLAGEGGLTWIKGRSGATDHQLFDTVRGATKELISNSTAAEATDADTLTAFNSDGFSLGADSNTNTNAATYASWTFRKQPKFFDVVTYTGDGGFKYVNHNLGSVPGCIIVKRTDSTGNWAVYHRSLGAGNTLYLNTTGASAGENDFQSVSSTQFAVYDDAGSWTNKSGGTYVAYLFAHNAGGFGLTGLDNVISCGSYTGNGSATGPVITLGYEPQWVLIKASSQPDNNWRMFDNMRGMDVNTTGSGDAILNANTSSAEAYTNRLSPTATGFQITDTAGDVNTSGATYIYIAIRRGPMKVPTSGTQVFSPTFGLSASNSEFVNAGFPIDLNWRGRTTGDNNILQDRLRGASGLLFSNLTNAESTSSAYVFTTQNGITFTSTASFTSWINWSFRRAPGFFDEVCYTGNGVSGRTLNHNLTVTPELLIIKSRNIINTWNVQTVAAGWNKFGYLSSDQAFGTDSFLTADPTSTALFLQSFAQVNGSGNTYVAYLFATVAGVSKVGSYTGTGTTQVINCGFTAGSRFVLIKRTDSTGDWYVWDSARGIVAGNDPYLLLNSTAAEVTNTDYVDTAATGFEISSTAPAAINANGGSFIFLAIA